MGLYASIRCSTRNVRSIFTLRLLTISLSLRACLQKEIKAPAGLPVVPHGVGAFPDAVECRCRCNNVTQIVRNGSRLLMVASCLGYYLDLSKASILYKTPHVRLIFTKLRVFSFHD